MKLFFVILQMVAHNFIFIDLFFFNQNPVTKSKRFHFLIILIFSPRLFTACGNFMTHKSGPLEKNRLKMSHAQLFKRPHCLRSGLSQRLAQRGNMKKPRRSLHLRPKIIATIVAFKEKASLKHAPLTFSS